MCWNEPVTKKCLLLSLSITPRPPQGVENIRLLHTNRWHVTKGDNRYSKEIGITLSNIYVLSVCISHSVYTCKYATIVKDIVIVFKSKEGVQVWIFIDRLVSVICPNDEDRALWICLSRHAEEIKDKNKQRRYGVFYFS